MDLGFTHQKTLLDVILQRGTNEIILELGVGWFSTPLLVALGRNGLGRLVSLEHDKAWLDKMHKALECPGGTAIWITELVDDWTASVRAWADTLAVKNKRPIVFVDQWPAEVRGPSIRALRDAGNAAGAQMTFVMHDAEEKDRGAYGVVEMFKGGREAFKYERIDRYEEGPWTVVWSDHVQPA